jgi:hypothetical protein
MNLKLSVFLLVSTFAVAASAVAAGQPVRCNRITIEGKYDDSPRKLEIEVEKLCDTSKPFSVTFENYHIQERDYMACCQRK